MKIEKILTWRALHIPRFSFACTAATNNKGTTRRWCWCQLDADLVSCPWSAMYQITRWCRLSCDHGGDIGEVEGSEGPRCRLGILVSRTYLFNSARSARMEWMISLSPWSLCAQRFYSFHSRGLLGRFIRLESWGLGHSVLLEGLFLCLFIQLT